MTNFWNERMRVYSKIKRLVWGIFPRSLLFRCESSLRYIYYLNFIGKNFQCNVCSKGLRAFIHLDDERLCPRCGSLRRTRRLWQILDKEFLEDGQKILDFSPSRSIYRLMKRRTPLYVSSDLSGDFISDVSFDIEHIDAADDHFDLIICYHVLEHIDDDRKAMTELWRVLKKGGACIVQTPFKEGETYEDSSITSPQEREQHFGQSDHVRVYSVNGLAGRMENAGFKVEIRNYREKAGNLHGFKETETVLIGHKPE